MLHQSPTEQATEPKTEDIQRAVERPHLGHAQRSPRPEVAEAEAKRQGHGTNEG